MQDLSSGEMRDLTPFLKDIPVVPQNEIAAQLANAQSRLSTALKEAKDTVQPDRHLQGPVFFVGEVIELKGGKFQVTRIEPGHMRLKGLPS